MKDLYNDRLRKVEDQLLSAFPGRINIEWVKTVSGEASPAGRAEEYDAFCRPARELLGRGGKRWRPVLMLLACEMTGGGEKALPLVPLVEFPHNGSLIVDDIEDNAEWRRGGRAVHLLYGVDLAVNAGNLLYYMPTFLIDSADVDDAVKYRLYRYYSENMRRLHLGQGLDILWHKEEIIPGPDEYEQMCRFKTGSLARMAAQAGVAAAGGSEKDAALLGSVCERMGVGFQIMDDVINLETGNPGKGRGDDIVENKKSLPVIYYINKFGGDRKKLSELFAGASEKGFKDGKKEIESAIDLISSSGALQAARERALSILEESAALVTGNYPESEASGLVLYMIRNFVP